MIKAAACFATLQPLTRPVVRALYLAIVLSIIGVAFDLNEYRVLSALHDKTYTDIDALTAAARVSDRLMRMQGIADFLLQLFLYGAIGRWIFRAAWNVRHLGAFAPTISPGMAIGWYFIPFASLVMPFRAMREIWQGSLLADRDARSQDAAQRDSILRCWWALYLITSFVGNAVLRLAVQDDSSVETLLVKNAASIAIDVLAISLDLVLISIMRRRNLGAGWRCEQACRVVVGAGRDQRLARLGRFRFGPAGIRCCPPPSLCCAQDARRLMIVAMPIDDPLNTGFAAFASPI